MELVMDFIENPPTSSGASVLATRAVKPGQGGHSKPAAAAAPQTPEIPPEAMTEVSRC